MPNPVNIGQEQVLKQFQLSKLSVSQKSDIEWGKQLAQYVDSTINGGLSGYYFSRNTRFAKNRRMANGRENVFLKFSDRLDFNGKQNYANLNWQELHICNRIISGLVGRWMGRNEKISVTATDTLSIKEKNEEYENLEFIIYNRKQVEELQKESGVQMVPQNDMLPQTKEELDLWQTQFQRLPEEILYELGCNDALAANGWFDATKEKMLHDSAEVGFVGTYTWMDDEGVIHVEWTKPENALYSASDFADFRDATWLGRVKECKISDLRRKYGKEFGGRLTEEEFWSIAQGAKDYKLNDNIRWQTEWNTVFMRPYDEWNVEIIEFEIKTVDSEPYTEVVTKKNKSTLIKKGWSGKPADNEKYAEDTNVNIYRCVYARLNQVVLEWGLKDNMIRPNDPKSSGNAEFSYSYYMYQNYDMRNIAVPEKIEEPIDQMILARLKVQQLVARMRPTGAAINWDALQNIDYGLGDQNKTIDVRKLYDQTGDLYYRGKDRDGNPMPVPIQELQNNGFLGQLEGLIKIYQFHFGVLKDELGEDPNLITQALQPRVTAGNVDASQRASDNATDYMYRAYLYCMEETAKKISCLLHKSVLFGAQAYRHLLGKEDVESRIFSTKAKMLPTEHEIAYLNEKMNQAIAANPELVMYLDTFKILRIAREDVKLAEEYYRLSMKKMKETQQEQSVQNQQLTFEGQAMSAERGEKAKQETESVKGGMELEKAKIAGDMQLKNTMAAAIMKMYELGQPIPPELKPVADALITNVLLPSAMQNKQTTQAIADQTVSEEQEMNQQPQQQNFQAA